MVSRILFSLNHTRYMVTAPNPEIASVLLAAKVCECPTCQPIAEIAEAAGAIATVADDLRIPNVPDLGNLDKVRRLADLAQAAAQARVESFDPRLITPEEIEKAANMVIEIQL